MPMAGELGHRACTTSATSVHADDGAMRGMVGMRVGGRRHLVISPHLAYGAAGVPGVIPPNAVVIVEVELWNVQGPTVAV
jgi:hypothetical protein